MAREGESGLANENTDPVVNAGGCAIAGRHDDVEGSGRYGYRMLDSYAWDELGVR